MPLQLITTSDGSHTLYNKALDENYHSTHGAINESKHVFINAGLNYIIKTTNPTNILEVGFGTGLNALLTGIEADAQKKIIHYTSIETQPLDLQLIEQLNYCEHLNIANTTALFKKIHLADWDVPTPITNNFTIEKKHTTLQDVILPTNHFHLIYFDAFAPRVQPELWTKEIFEKLYDCLNTGGVLVTYCAKGEVKRTLKACGLKVESLPGPPGKREMTRAIK